MTGRAFQVLSRLPAHLEPTRPGKQLSAVVEALVVDLERLSADLAGVRRSHRLAHADTLRDVLLLGGMHGLARPDVELVIARIEATRSIARALEAAVVAKATAERDELAERLFTLWGIQGGSPRLADLAPPFAPGETPNLDAAARALIESVRMSFGFSALLDGVRRRVERVARLHAEGNGTVYALIEAAASVLDLELDVEANQRVKAASRPVVRASTGGTPGTATWSYVVVARPLVRNVARNSRLAVVVRGPAALSETDFVKLEWSSVPDARDYLVYRVRSGGEPSTVGLLTPTPLESTTTTFRDTGVPAVAPATPLPETDDGLFHSADRFWHSSFVRDRIRPMRSVEPALPPQFVALDSTIVLDDFATALGQAPAAVLERAGALAAAGALLDGEVHPDLALRVANRLGSALVFRRPISVRALASALAAPRADVFRALAALLSEGANARISIELSTADPLAASFGFLVVQSRRLFVDDGVRLGELERRTGVELDQLVSELVKLDVPGAGAETRLTFAEAARLLPRVGFRAVRPRIFLLDARAPISVAELSVRAALPASRLLRDLALLGVAAPTPGTLLDADRVAQLLRPHRFAVREILAASDDLVGIEENPMRDEETASTPRVHTELFPVFRRGFGRVRLEARIVGIETRTVGPMLVNRDEGHGIGLARAVPQGKMLVFSADGRARLTSVEPAEGESDEDVTGFAYSWQGACFAGTDDDPANPRDFLFDGPDVPENRRATFAVAAPAGALDPEFPFPHAGAPIAMPGVNVGQTRFAFFVQEAHFAGLDESVAPPAAIPPVPRPKVGFADGAVFGVGSGEERAPAAEVSLAWREHEAYAVRVLIPKRFSALDTEGAPTVAERVRVALERVRPVGVEVRVEYQDDRWILGEAAVSADRTDPILALMGGTALWPPPTG
ncbi:MAG TPA: hypothetical protein VFQ35_24765 [Polyangiaceae bacterium]|nr:hypothetical protein [Polyangiaceae bacterium]